MLVPGLHLRLDIPKCTAPSHFSQGFTKARNTKLHSVYVQAEGHSEQSKFLFLEGEPAVWLQLYKTRQLQKLTVSRPQYLEAVFFSL